MSEIRSREHVDTGPELTSDEFLSKLKSALAKDGDFPASAKIVNELRSLANDPRTNGNQITEVILREPSLATRILHLVNSSYYRRAKPIMTVSQAVIQIGMKPIADLCAGLVLLQKFVPMARKGGPFANCLRQSVLTSILSSSFSAEIGGEGEGKGNETGYIAGSFAELGSLLLAYYFPKIYESAHKRAELKKIELAESIRQITGLSPMQMSIEVIKALDLPKFYFDALEFANQPQVPTANKKISLEEEKLRIASQSVGAGSAVATAISGGKTKQELDVVLSRIKKQLGVEVEAVNAVMGNLTKVFREHCATVELDLPSLPDFLVSYSPDASNDSSDEDKMAQSGDHFAQFINEVKQSVENREPTASVITSVMETLAWGLGFERVLLMLVAPGRRKLMGRMLLGKADNIDPNKVEREISPTSSGSESKAFYSGAPVFNGESVFRNGWPFVTIPIGSDKRALGVIYADRIDHEEELTDREKAAIGLLAELLDRSVGNQS